MLGLFSNFLRVLTENSPLSQALYITDMPTTAAWIDHAFGYYHQVFAAFLVQN